MSNSTSPHEGYPLSMEFAAYDRFPPVVKKAIREAPFQVCCVDMVNNYAVMGVYRDMGPEQFAEWLEGMLAQTYRTKILPAVQPKVDQQTVSAR